jgi:hypothetical protein
VIDRLPRLVGHVGNCQNNFASTEILVDKVFLPFKILPQVSESCTTFGSTRVSVEYVIDEDPINQGLLLKQIASQSKEQLILRLILEWVAKYPLHSILRESLEGIDKQFVILGPFELIKVEISFRFLYVIGIDTIVFAAKGNLSGSLLASQTELPDQKEQGEVIIFTPPNFEP